MKNKLVEIITKSSPHLSWIDNGMLYLCQHGSKAYNCHKEDGTSDDDYKSIFIPPAKYFTGFLHTCDQIELKAPNPDCVIYNIKKFFQLACSANPNLLEMLYVKPEYRLYVHPLMEKILENRDKFLSTKVRFSYGGFAFDQMRRVKLHRSWLLTKMQAPPTREEFGLPSEPVIGMENLKAAMSVVDKELDRFNFNFMEDLTNDQRIEIKNAMHEMLTNMQIFHGDLFEACAKKVNMDDNLIFILQKEREYKGKQENWRKYCDWKKNRNPERAKDEERIGFDCKFGYHIYRLYTTCKEILIEGKINVFREDRDEIMKIRRGEWTFEQLDEFVINADKELQILYETTKILPKSPDVKFLDKLCQDIVGEKLGLI